MNQNQISLKQHLDEAMQDVRVTESMKSAVLERMKNDRRAPARMPVRAKKIAAIAAVAAVVAVFPLTAAARNLPALAEWIRPYLNGSLIGYVYPVEKSCTDNGIRVTLESAVNDGHHAQVYYTLQDVEGKGRLGADLDLCDTDSISIGGDSASTSSVVSYDEATQTARCVSEFTVSRDMTNSPVTFRLSMLMAHENRTGIFDTGLSLPALLPAAAETVRAGSVTVFDDIPDRTRLLKPDAMRIPLREGLDSVYISNIGYIDGRLHIQFKWEESFDNHGFFCLMPADAADFTLTESGMPAGACEAAEVVDFRTVADEKQCGFNRFVKRQEYVFAVSSEELKAYSLLADLYLDGDITQGKWEVSYRMQSTRKRTFRAAHAESVEVTPLGVYVLDYSGEGTPRLRLTFDDGSSYEQTGFELETTTGWFRTKRRFCGRWQTETDGQGWAHLVSVSLDGEEAQEVK